MLRWNGCGIACVLLAYGFLFYADYVVMGWLLKPEFAESLPSADDAYRPRHSSDLQRFVSSSPPANSSYIRMFRSLKRLSKSTRAPKPILVDEGEETANSSTADEDGEDFYRDEQGATVSIERYVVRGSRSPFVGQDWTMCYKCDSYRPPRAHHCRVCHRCVRKMDHHCPWVNNCVGEYNQKYFLQFIFYVGVLSLYSIVLIISSWLRHESHNGMVGIDRNDRVYHFKLVHSLCLAIESILFGLFSVAVTCDQLQAIFNDETVIETFQRRGQRRRQINKGRYALLQDVCGPSHWSLWALPCSVLPLQKDVVRFAKMDNSMNV